MLWQNLLIKSKVAKSYTLLSRNLIIQVFTIQKLKVKLQTNTDHVNKKLEFLALLL